MAIVRKIIRFGNSKGVTLPSDWLKLYGLDVGSEVVIEPLNSGLLIKVKNK